MHSKVAWLVAGDRPESRTGNAHEFPLDRAFTTWLPAFESGLRSFASSNSATSSASAEHTQKAAEGDAQRDTVASLYRWAPILCCLSQLVQQRSLAVLLDM